MFGLVSGLEVELDYVSLKELQEVKRSMGLQIERDLHFEPITLGELEERHRKHSFSPFQARLLGVESQTWHLAGVYPPPWLN